MLKICSNVGRRSTRSLQRAILATRRFSSEQQDVVVVGGGPGGYACAIKAAQLGLKTTCVESRGRLGGTCLNVGCIPSKALLHNTHLLHVAQHEFADRGILADNVRVDLPQLMKTKAEIVTGLTGGIEFLFKKNKVTYSKGFGKITSPNEVTVSLLDGGEEKINAKHIVIATGSESAAIPGINIDEQKIVTSTGALEFDSIPEKLVVVGAGVIGLEMGSVWARLGSQVTVVEFLDRILPGMDNDVASKFQRMLKKQGFEFKLSTAVQGVEESGSGLVVTVEDKKKGETLTLDADRVLVAIGRRPFTEGLGIEQVGIEMDGRMVKVNDTWQTNLSNVYAIGDVIRGPMLAHKAEEEGIAVAELIATGHGHVNYNAIPGVVYTHPEIASVGKTEEELKAEGRAYKKGVFNMMANSRARCNGDTEGFVKILADKETDQVLGCHIIGPNAGEMVAEAALGIEYGASSEDLGRTCHAHPTLSEAFKEACMECFASAIHQ